MSDILVKNFYKQREDFNQTSRIRNKELPFPEGVDEWQDIIYSADYPETRRLDIYRPKDKMNHILPVIINVHGGGMILGSKEFNRFFCAQISAMGFLVFNVEYRLVPEVQVYDQFTDISIAMDFVQNAMTEYHGDANHVYMVADSGGAYLATYTVALQQYKGLASAAHVTPSSLKVHALGLISGMFYTTKLDKIGLFMPKYLYGKNYKKSAFAPYINPEHPDMITALPPCCLITSHNDMLQHYTLQFEKALTRHHIPHELINYPKNKKLTHAFSVFEPYLEESIEAVKSMISFLSQY